MGFVMPFAAFCKKCPAPAPPSNDNSYAYMVEDTSGEIKASILEHFKNVHNTTPNPNPWGLSWSEDFKEKEFELTQYGGYDRDMSHLTFIFRGSSVRQFDCGDYTISVITKRHYEDCIDNLNKNERIDHILFEYF